VSPLLLPDVEAAAPSDLAALQAARLRSLVGRLKGIEGGYWGSKLAGVDPDAVGGVDDIRRLPFTLKAELRDSYPFGMLAVPLSQTIRLHASSGTRGQPTIVAYTASDVGVFAEVNARAIAAAGGRPDDVLHVAYGYGLFTGGLGLHYGGERLGATVVPASGGNAGFQVRMMADLGATGLACTPSFALLLAERAASDGLMEAIRERLRYAVCGAEPWSEPFRTKLEEAWGGIDACDIYGLSEIIGPGVAMECAEGKGALHVFEDHFYPEILDPDSDEPVAPGEQGELVLTTLTKEAMPVIRYRTGDITRIVPELCPCGRTLRRMARLSGRVDDMLVIRGINVFPSAVETVLLDDTDLGGQYQILVDRRSPMPELVIRVELARKDLVPDREKVAQRLTERLNERLRLRVQAQMLDPDSIPRSEVGKVKRVFEIESDDDIPPV
jgi:phenylacetate-CoA ligase